MCGHFCLPFMSDCQVEFGGWQNSLFAWLNASFGPHATAHITTYNDVAGNQINSTRNITTGNITAGKGGDGGNTESAAGYSAGGSGGPGGSGGSVNIS